MKLRRVHGQADDLPSLYKLVLVLALLVVTGCSGAGEGTDGYSQDFPVPEGSAKAIADGPALTRSQRRRKEIEESRNEPAAKPKGKRSRP